MLDPSDRGWAQMWLIVGGLPTLTSAQFAATNTSFCSSCWSVVPCRLITSARFLVTEPSADATATGIPAKSPFLLKL